MQTPEQCLAELVSIERQFTQDLETCHQQWEQAKAQLEASRRVVPVTFHPEERFIPVLKAEDLRIHDLINRSKQVEANYDRTTKKRTQRRD